MRESDKKPTETELACNRWEPPDYSEIKIKLNTLVWENARPSVTLAQAEAAAGKAFEAIWALCELEGK